MTTLKTVSMYLRAAKTEAEDAGESTEGMANSVSELRDEILGLTGNQVDIQLDEDTFKSTYQILQELAGVWHTLTDTTQANILELVGGKRNANVVSAILENFSVAEKALGTSASASGSALAENEKYLDSINGKISQFKATFEELSQNFIDGNFVKDIVELATKLLNVLNTISQLINAVGGLNTILSVTVGIIAIIKAQSIIGLLQKIVSTITLLTTGVGVFALEMKSVFTASLLSGLGRFKSALLGIKAGFDYVGISASAAQLKMAAFMLAILAVVAVVKIVDHFTVSLEESREKLAELNQESQRIESELSSLNDELETTAQRIAELEGKDALTFTEEAELKNLKKQNAELKRKIELLAIEAEYKDRQKREAFVETMDKDIKSGVEYDGVYINSAGAPVVETQTREQYISDQFDKYLKNQQGIKDWENLIAKNYDNEDLRESYTKEKEKLEEENKEIERYLNERKDIYAKYVADTSGERIENPQTPEDEQYNEYLDKIDEFNYTYHLIFGGETAPQTVFESLVRSGSIAEASEELVKLGEAGQVTAETLAKAEFQPIIDKIKELGIVAERDGADKIRELGNQYNSIVNGNVDYNKRPIIPANEMQKYYPEFPNDGVATTYSQTMTIGEGEALYTINVTPILEDGTVLTKDELNNYVSNLVTDGTTEELLASDTKKLVIHAIDGDYNESEWKQIEEQLGAIKEQHINLVNQFNKNNPDTTWTEYSKGAGILEEIALLFNLLGESAGDAADDIDDSTSAMSDFTKAMSGVQGLQKGLDQLDKIYADIKDGKNFDYSSVLNNKDFTEAFGDLGKSYDDFMKTILNNPSNINACREAFNKLINTYILSSEALNGLTEETKSSTIAFLKQQGVSNAEAIVNERLAISREKARISSELHTNATSAEIVKLQEESEQSQVTLQALAELALAKLDINKSAIDLTSDINQIIALAEKAGATTTSLKELARAKVLLSEAEQLEWAASVYTDENGNPFRDSKTGRPIDLYTNAKNAATQAYKEAQDIINTPIEYTLPEYIGGPTSNSGKNDPKKYDWIETSISRMEREIQSAQRTADSAYKSIEDRIAATNKQIKLTTQEISLQEKALKRYKKEADSVKLSEDIKSKVRDGSIDINKYDDKTQTLINDYKEWYEKSLDCADAIAELDENLSSLYEKEFDDIASDFDNQLSQLEHLANIYENGLADLEARGYLGGYEYYDALKQAKQQEITVLEKKLDELTTAMETAISKGDIKEGSDSWYSMQGAINSVKEELQSCNTEIIDIDNSVRDLDWETFDFAQERIKALTNEAEFLIELMDESDFFNDKGNITSKGLAAAGLHAVSYNTYMKQADGYAQEILKINKELADDPSKTKLIERREELLELQRESILSAESEKDAISDMVEEGINKQLDAMKELIDTYKESLQSAKDLYEYQKKIKDHTSNIATLQKQLSAYENDTSEETRAKIQKIRVDLEKAQEELEETEYDKYISDTEKMLDDFYEDYEETLNARMDNIDALITTMIDTINLNAFDISNTIRSACSDVGYTITDEMRAIWNSPGGVVSEYGSSSFGNSSTSNTVDNIVSKVIGLFTKGSELANNLLNPSVPSNPIETQTPSSGGNPSKNDIANGNKGSNKEIVTGGKINAGNAKIYPSPSGKGATGQYFSGDPIYIVLGEENGYLKVRHHKSKSGVSGWFKKSDVKAYKTGGLVDYTGIAWVDGSPSKPETVLDAEDTQNLVELKEAMKRLRGKNGMLGSELFNSENDMIKGLSESLSKTLNASDFAKQSIDFGGISITIPIDHVSDYNDFVSKLQEDGQFEDFIQDITLGKLTNGSSFSKYKYKW